ncbi:hypothetical protein KGO95_00655 [Patescibacteria group bacterium]|nr:hypothetical protein [Patescibacteria group bacterium]
MKYGLLLAGVLLLVAPFAYAGTPQRALLLAQTSAVTAASLGISDSGLLPTNPFYFIKEWGRAIMRATTASGAPQANLELRFINEKAAELQQVDQISGMNASALTTALRSYIREQGMLQSSLQALPEISQDPRVTDVLTAISALTPSHERLLDALAQEYNGETVVENLLSSAKGLLEQSLLTAAGKAAPDQFAQIFQTALTEGLSGDLKNTYAAEIVGRLQAAAPQPISDALAPAYAGFTAQSAAEVQTFLATASLSDATAALQELPDSPERQNVGIQIYEKQKRDLEAPRAAAVLVLPSSGSTSTSAILCSTIKSNFDDLWNLFKTDRMSNQEYLQKYAVLRDQYANCQLPTILPSYPASSTPAVSSPGTTTPAAVPATP